MITVYAAVNKISLKVFLFANSKLQQEEDISYLSKLHN